MAQSLKIKDMQFFRFKKFDDNRYLLTNDFGNYLFLLKNDFEQLRDDPSQISKDLYNKLFENGFINTKEKSAELINQYRIKNSFINEGPSLHIVVVTLRCDHNCLYCHASKKGINDKKYDMTPETAKKVVDFILETTAQNLCVEFQGGEPLVNYDVIKYIIEYFKTKTTSKNVIFSIVTNLNLLDDDKLKYLQDNKVSICTSLDGPEKLHNKYRKTKENNSYQQATSWIKKINKINLDKQESNQKFNRINALLTTTSDSLKHYKEIIDTYRENGFNSIQLRTLNPFGYGKNQNTLLYSPEEFLTFYQKAMDYILEINKNGELFIENTAKIFLNKIINKKDSNYLDLRSPCGAGIGQLAYNYDGNIFTCDEGRMVNEMGDDIFLLGNVNEISYQDAMNNDVVKSLCVASCLEGIPGCQDCPYNPYCGVCPIYNYTEQGTIFGQMPTNERCQISMGI